MFEYQGVLYTYSDLNDHAIASGTTVDQLLKSNPEIKERTELRDLNYRKFADDFEILVKNER